MAMASCLRLCECGNKETQWRGGYSHTEDPFCIFVFFFLSFVDLYFLNRRFMPSLQKIKIKNRLLGNFIHHARAQSGHLPLFFNNFISNNETVKARALYFEEDKHSLLRAISLLAGYPPENIEDFIDYFFNIFN